MNQQVEVLLQRSGLSLQDLEKDPLFVEIGEKQFGLQFRCITMEMLEGLLRVYGFEGEKAYLAQAGLGELLADTELMNSQYATLSIWSSLTYTYFYMEDMKPEMDFDITYWRKQKGFSAHHKAVQSSVVYFMHHLQMTSNLPPLFGEVKTKKKKSLKP